MAVAIKGGGTSQSIPDFIPGYGNAFPNAKLLTGFYWNSYNNFCYVQTPTVQFNVFLNVPPLTVAGFLNPRDPDAFYTFVSNNFSPCLLTESCQQLVTETGAYIVTR